MALSRCTRLKPLPTKQENKVRGYFTAEGSKALVNREFIVYQAYAAKHRRNVKLGEVGDVKSRAAEYAFGQADAEHIMMNVMEDIQYIGDDETHFLFRDDQGQQYVFHKKNGYYSVSENV